MEKLRTLDLFSGIGGFSLGLDSTGYFETVAFCEIEEFPCKVLNKHWPDVPIYNDVRELSYEKLQADGLISRRRGIDVICGGYPCQPFSVAGRQGGEEDPRHLWPEYFRLVRELRPHYVIGENVGGHLRLGLDSVLEDLDSENYTVRCFSVEAASLGAPHRRERIFWIAVSDAQSERRGGRNRGGRGAEQRELLKTEQEGRTLGREAERCSELPGQAGEDSAPDVVDAHSVRLPQHHEAEEESSGRRTSPPSLSTSNNVADADDGSNCGTDVTDTHSEGLEGTEEARNSEEERTIAEQFTARQGAKRSEEERGETAFESYLGGGNDGISAWLDGSWDRGIPRVAPSNKLRVPRLKALGNAVLPQLVYMVGMTIVVSASCDSLSTKSSENEEESGG